MKRFADEDLTGSEFRECDLSETRLVGVVMQDAVIDGLVTNLVVNGVEVTAYVEAELELWLDTVTAEQLAAPAPVPDDDRWPPYARGRTVLQCLRTVLNEEHEHHGFCVRDLDLVESAYDS